MISGGVAIPKACVASFINSLNQSSFGRLHLFI